MSLRDYLDAQAYSWWSLMLVRHDGSGTVKTEVFKERAMGLETFSVRAAARRWLHNIGLEMYPWIVEGQSASAQFVIGFDPAADFDGTNDVLESPAARKAPVPVRFTDGRTWVVACYLTARARGEVVLEEPAARELHNLPTAARDTACDAKWGGFLLLAAKDEELWRSIEGVARLGGEDAVVRYVGEAIDEFARKTATAYRLRLIRNRQESRARRLDGRARRPSDEDWEREALPPRLPRGKV